MTRLHEVPILLSLILLYLICTVSCAYDLLDELPFLPKIALDNTTTTTSTTATAPTFTVISSTVLRTVTSQVRWARPTITVARIVTSSQTSTSPVSFPTTTPTTAPSTTPRTTSTSTRSSTTSSTTSTSPFVLTFPTQPFYVRNRQTTAGVEPDQNLVFQCGAPELRAPLTLLALCLAAVAAM